MAVMRIEAVFAALPDGPLSEKEFDDALRRIFKIAEWDGAMLEAYRTTAFHNHLIVEDADGLLVKAAELPRSSRLPRTRRGWVRSLWSTRRVPRMISG